MNPATASALLSPTLAPTIQPIIVQVPQTNASSTDYVAWAGFLLALGLGFFELWKYHNDRPRLKITFRFNQEIVNELATGELVNNPEGRSVWSVDVANVGTRNIIITNCTFARSDSKKYFQLVADFNGRIPPRYTLAPGDSHTYTITDETVDQRKATQVILLDATGKSHSRKIKYRA